MSKKVVVIGAGYAGLASACIAAKQGHDVTVIEKNECEGGRASVWKSEGFTFDMGPSWYLMPDAFENFYALMDTTPQAELDLRRLDPNYKMFFGNEDVIDVPADIEGVYKLFDELEENGAKKLKKYLAKAQKQYEISMDSVLYKPFNSVFDFFSPKIAIKGSQLPIFSNLDSYGKRYFKSDRALKILQYTTVFLGGAPKNTPAMYSMMAHVDFNLGVWYPIGGMHAVAKSMKKMAEKHGAKFVFNEPVTKILTKNSRAVGVKTIKKSYQADAVIANADYWFCETHLLDKEDCSYDQKYWDKRVVAPSGMCIYLGLKGTIKDLDHHNLFVDNDWHRHFNTIFDEPSWPDSPSYYVCNPNKTQSDLAPEGCENLFFLVPLASGLKDSEKKRNEFADMILNHFQQLIGEDFTDRVVVKRIFTHRDFKQRYNSFKGTALGLAHTLGQTGSFRPHMKSKKVKGLYYAGQYTHPGVGVPMCLISGQLAAQEIDRA